MILSPFGGVGAEISFFNVLDITFLFLGEYIGSNKSREGIKIDIFRYLNHKLKIKMPINASTQKHPSKTDMLRNVPTSDQLRYITWWATKENFRKNIKHSTVICFDNSRHFCSYKWNTKSSYNCLYSNIILFHFNNLFFHFAQCWVWNLGKWELHRQVICFGQDYNVWEEPTNFSVTWQH